MTEIILVLLSLANLALLIPVLVFAVEIFSAVGRGQRRPAPLPSARPSAAILVPAHDEADGIAETVRGLRGQLRPGDRLLVVADNCTDGTAMLAREAGAEVIERQDPSRRGKGFALDFGVRHLAAAPPEVVVIVDADCSLQPGCIDRLVARAAASQRPVQGLYLMSAPAGAGLNLQVAEFAFLVKNRARAAGLHRLGFPCHLTGSGMGFPWSVIRDAHLAHASLVEDMKLGLDLALAGRGAAFCEDARIDSHFPFSQAGASSQRRRWEEGHLGMIAQALRVLPAAVRSGNAGAVALVVDVLVPPLTLLVLLLGAAFVVTAAVTYALSLAPVALAVSLLCLALFGVSVLAAWAAFGRHVLPPMSLLRVFPYVLRKLALYPRLALGSRVGTWIRTDRRRPD
ncbi:glycosyltransferase family 2 protein [Aminobacter sp. Piv2-1]|uniref:glycosyltransferase family 2 protein n=1 Tax=Aminobacter sp. Piv2-1 TaxID=3031122 RepID=UPI0030AC0C94